MYTSRRKTMSTKTRTTPRWKHIHRVPAAVSRGVRRALAAHSRAHSRDNARLGVDLIPREVFERTTREHARARGRSQSERASVSGLFFESHFFEGGARRAWTTVEVSNDEERFVYRSDRW